MKEKKSKKKIIIGAIVVFFLIGIISGLTNSNDSSTSTNSESTTQEKTTASKSKAESKDSKIESGSYKIDGIDFVFTDNVRNDATGNWKISLVSDNKTAEDYAIDYYTKMFKSNDEIHAIVNFNLKTTAKLSMLTDELLEVTTYEYVKGEEHDADKLFTGMLLTDITININTGEVEQLQ